MREVLVLDPRGPISEAQIRQLAAEGEVYFTEPQGDWVHPKLLIVAGADGYTFQYVARDDTWRWVHLSSGGAGTFVTVGNAVGYVLTEGARRAVEELYERGVAAAAPPEELPAQPVPGTTSPLS